MTVTELLHEAQHLTVEERREFLLRLLDEYLENLPAEPLHDITELEGIGAHLYDGTDAQEYVNQLRDEWDRP